MSNLLKASKTPPLEWVASWLDKDEFGMPATDVNNAIGQPKGTEVQFKIRSQDRNTLKVTVVPDKALLGFEYSYAICYLDFKDKLLGQFSEERQQEDTFGPVKFKLWPRCLQGKAKVHWTKVASAYPTAGDQTLAAFDEAMTFYFERVAGYKYIGDALIRWMRHQRKPALLEFSVYQDRRAEVLSYITCGMFRSRLNVATAQELAEQVFLHQPVAHQAKYAETHEEVEEDQDALRTAFEGFHEADKQDGTYADVEKNVKKAHHARKRKADGHDDDQSNRRKHRPSNRNRRDDDRKPPFRSHTGRRGYNGGDRHRRDRYDHRREDRDRRRYDDDRRGRRDDRRRGDDERRYNNGGRGRGNYRRRDDANRDDKKRDHAMHVDDDDRRSRSRSRSLSRSASRGRDASRSASRGRSRSASRSRSIDSRSVVSLDAHFVDEDRSPNNNSSNSSRTSDPPGKREQPRWMSETSRAKIGKQNAETDEHYGRPVHGYGSWYRREPGVYSQSEFDAPQGHQDRVRTIDCSRKDQAYRQAHGYDSGLESDWQDRTGVNPKYFHKLRSFENEASRDRNQKGKKDKYRRCT